MPPSEAYSTESSSPRSRASSSKARISSAAMPRRRWVGRTPTRVGYPTTSSPPGTVIGIVNAPAVPTMSAPSKAAKFRSGSAIERSRSISSRSGTSLDASSEARRNGSSSSAVILRTRWSIRRAYEAGGSASRSVATGSPGDRFGTATTNASVPSKSGHRSNGTSSSSDWVLCARSASSLRSRTPEQSTRTPISWSGTGRGMKGWVESIGSSPRVRRPRFSRSRSRAAIATCRSLPNAPGTSAVAVSNASVAAAPIATWSGWPVIPSGPNVTTTSGANSSRIERSCSTSPRRGNRPSPPSGCRRKRTSGSSPNARQDARSSASRTVPSSSRVASDGSAMRPASPLVARITVSSSSSRAWSARLPPTPNVSSSGCAKMHATRRTGLRQRREIEQRLEPDREPRADHHGPGGHQHARHERGPIGRVVPDRERLSLPAEDDLMVRHEPGQTHRMDADPLDVAPAHPLERLGERAAPRPVPLLLDPPDRGDRGPRGSVRLLVVVELDDLDGRQVADRLCGEALHQHGAEREVRRDDHVRFVTLVREELVDLLEVLERDPRRADDRVHRVRDAPADVVHRDVRVREVDRDLGVGLEQPIELVGDRRIDLGVSDHLPDLLSDLRAIDRGDEREVVRVRQGPADHQPHPPAGTDHAHADHAIASLLEKGPRTVTVIGCESTRSAARAASSGVTASMRPRSWFTVRVSPCPISDLPSRDMRPPGSSSDSTSDPFMWPLARSNSSGPRPLLATSSSCARTIASTSFARPGVVPA